MEAAESRDDENQNGPGAGQLNNGTAIPRSLQKQNQTLVRIGGFETLAGAYALLLTSLGVALPMSQYTAGDDFQTRRRYYTGFSLYVYGVAVLSQVYITVRAKIYRVKYKRESKSASSYETDLQRNSSYRKREEDTSDRNHDDRPNSTKLPCEIIWLHNKAPYVYETRWGFNMFTRLGILVFGICAVTLEICKMVDYTRKVGPDGCHDAGSLAVFILRVIFFLNQSFFLFAHHKVVFNFQRHLVRFGLLHQVSANLIAWVFTIIHDSVEVFALLSVNDHDDHDNVTLNHTEDISLAERLCQSQDSVEYAASSYITPLVIGYFLLAATILYHMYESVGTRVFHTRPLPEVWETEASSWDGSCVWSWVAGSGGLVLFLATCSVTGWFWYLEGAQVSDENLRNMGNIHAGSSLVLNAIGLACLVPGFYQLNKLLFKPTYMTKDHGEEILLITLGGFFLLLGFLAVTASRSVGAGPSHGNVDGPPPLALTVCLLEAVQVSTQYAFTHDATHRRLHSVKQMPGRSMVIFQLFLNLSMWLVNAFLLRDSIGSVLFFRRHNILSWILIINTTLPLAMYYRYVNCVLLVDVLRNTYGWHYLGKQWFAQLIN